jgi:hypothetical protein
MKPSTREIIENIIKSLDEVVLPVVEDKQAASSLRSARTLLDHLARRVEGDAEMLLADNADARQVLAAIVAQFADQPASAPLVKFLAADTEALPGTITELQSRNEAMQHVIDVTLRGLPPAGAEAAVEAAIRAALRGYLDRRLARERDMIFPAFLGPPF